MHESSSSGSSLVHDLVSGWLLLLADIRQIRAELRCVLYFVVDYLHRGGTLLKGLESTSLRPLIIQDLVEFMLLLSLLFFQIKRCVFVEDV